MRNIVMLHTSDWHLGHMLYKKRRDDEFTAFMDWIESVIRGNGVSVLLLSGDVFDTPMPGTTAQKMYYDFLGRIAIAGVKHAIITAGNHDSPTFLTAPAELLRSFNIHVIGMTPENPEDEIRVLRSNDGEPEMIVCAAPYLRERDLRTSVPGESSEEKNARLLEGLRKHYSTLAELAENLRREYSAEIPVVAMGHLFVAGCETQAGDGTRDLYVGNLGRVPVDIFGDVFDYVALGHIHKPQCVGGIETRRYSGSPLPMSFGEKDTPKSVTVVQFSGRKLKLETVQTPQFRHLEQVTGNRNAILRRISELAGQSPEIGDKIWVEVQHDGSEAPLDLSERVQELAEGTQLEILCVKQAPGKLENVERENDTNLENLDAEEIFRRFMTAQNVQAEKWDECLGAFKELLLEYYNNAGQE